jgi:hypothetical protein
LKVGHPRVTHPFATLLRAEAPFAFDLHVLGTPPALILSQDQTLMLKLRTLAPRSTLSGLTTAPRELALTRAPVDLALSRCSVCLCVSGAAQRNHPNTLTSIRPTTPHDPPADTQTGCACTFYLVFKEPVVAATRFPRPLVHPIPSSPTSLGEPSNLTTASPPCQLFSAPHRTSKFRPSQNLKGPPIGGERARCAMPSIKPVRANPTSLQGQKNLLVTAEQVCQWSA